MSTCKYISPYACHRYTYRSRHVPTIAFSIRFPAATRSPDPPVWPRSGVMILPTSLRIYILSQLYRPLLVVTFRSRSFICMFHVWSAYRYMYLDVDRGSAFWARPASSCAKYTSRTLPIDHSPRTATDENDTGIAVPERTVLPFRTPCSVIFTSLISALRIAARSFGKARPPPPLPPPLPPSLPP